MIFRIIKNKKGITPALSGLILVAVSVSYALIASSWLGSMTVSLMSFEELTITNCEWAQDYSYADLIIRNTGVQGAILDSVQVNGKETQDFEVVEGGIRINPGRSSTIRITQSFSGSTKYEFQLSTKRQTLVSYLSISQPGQQSQNQASIHYINAISNVDDSSDKGTHSNFANQQGGQNNLFDTITEADMGAGLTQVLQYPDASTINYGIQSNFVNIQNNSPDGNYMTIQEENLGGGHGTHPSVRSKSYSVESGNTQNHDVSLPNTIEAGDTLLVVFVCDDDEQITWENEGTEWNVIYEEDAGSSGPTMSIAWKKANGDEDETTITVQTSSNEQSTHISYAIQNAEDPYVSAPEVASEASGYGSYPDSNDLNPSGGVNSYLWLAFYGSDKSKTAQDYPGEYQDNRETYASSTGSSSCAIGAATRQYTAASDDSEDFRIQNAYWEATTVAVYPEQNAIDDYELDFEYQWTNADYDETNEQVCVYVESAIQDGEKLITYEWNGATWQLLGTLDSNGWNNFTTSLLTGSSYKINITDEDKSDDSTQSSWNIDCIITDCSSTENNYELDLEVQFTGVDVDKNYEQICIYMGSTTAEPLDVYIWNEDTWELLSSNLMQNQWNNMTQTITQDTVTLRFVGSLEINDEIQDNWQIDTILLYGPP